MGEQDGIETIRVEHSRSTFRLEECTLARHGQRLVAHGHIRFQHHPVALFHYSHRLTCIHVAAIVHHTGHDIARCRSGYYVSVVSIIVHGGLIGHACGLITFASGIPFGLGNNLFGQESGFAFIVCLGGFVGDTALLHRVSLNHAVG